MIRIKVILKPIYVSITYALNAILTLSYLLDLDLVGYFSKHFVFSGMGINAQDACHPKTVASEE